MSLLLNDLRQTMDDFRAKFGPPPGPLVCNPVDLPWLRNHREFDRERSPSGSYSDIPRHWIAPFMGFQVVEDANMPVGVLACDDGKGPPTVFHSLDCPVSAPRHRKLRLNRIRRREKDFRKAAIIARAHRAIRNSLSIPTY